jgi:2-polyprenyl-6-methoxyphenol hydroxylase-like FAD-dependent oxidoreductase
MGSLRPSDEEEDMSPYDIITVGGGLGGAALARSMAEAGARVLVLERETAFKDRVRGEGLTTWGASEAKELGIYDLLAGCGQEVPGWEDYVGAMQIGQRDMRTTTPQALPTLTFYHPTMQESLIQAAETAGAEVRRGERATGVTPGSTPSVTIQREQGFEETLSARLVVGVDGRGSVVRKWAGFTEKRNPDRLLISGTLFEGSQAPQHTVRLVSDFGRGTASILFPLGRSKVRTYLIQRADGQGRLQGRRDVPRFIEQAVATGMPAEYFDGAEAAGPLATFDGADSWVEHPYSEGVALVGDAAASSDPSWGQGLGLTLRDARVLRDALLAHDDWDAAGHMYAAEHDRYYGVIRTVEDWFTTFAYDTSHEGHARRERMLPALAQDPTRAPDTFFSGPDHEADDQLRRRFFAEV